MITSVIFSKNRPLQLDLCLKSINQNFLDSSHNVVIYKCDKSYNEAYNTLKYEYKDTVDFLYQYDSLFSDILSVINGCDNEYICFFTDDDIVYRTVPDLSDGLFIENASCLSLRMGLNINKRSHEGIWSDDPPIQGNVYSFNNDDRDKAFIFWNKTSHVYGSYWSYSLSVDGHIFKVKDMKKMMKELCHLQNLLNWKQNPNELEGAMQRFWTQTPPLIVSPAVSCVVNSPNNRTSESCEENVSGEYFNFSEVDLRNKFMDGKRIDLNKINFPEINSPHIEINILEGLS